MEKIASRGSVMALAQTRQIISELQRVDSASNIEIQTVDTSGCIDTESKLGAYGGKEGAFIREVRDQLTQSLVQMAMHSLKDMPGDQAFHSIETDTKIGAYLKRGDPRDCLVFAKDIRKGARLERLSEFVIGTNSVRRTAFLKNRFRGISVIHYRGAVSAADDGGRLAKLDARMHQKLPYGRTTNAPADALVLSASGLERIGCKDRIDYRFSVDEMCPAIGQGVVVVECLRDDHETLQKLQLINHKPTEICSRAERSLLLRLNGNCRSPIAGHAKIVDGVLQLKGVVLSIDGKYMSEADASSDILEPEQLAAQVAQKLIARGALEVIAEAIA